MLSSKPPISVFIWNLKQRPRHPPWRKRTDHPLQFCRRKFGQFAEINHGAQIRFESITTKHTCTLLEINLNPVFQPIKWRRGRFGLVLYLCRIYQSDIELDPTKSGRMLDYPCPACKLDPGVNQGYEFSNHYAQSPRQRVAKRGLSAAKADKATGDNAVIALRACQAYVRAVVH